MNTLELWPELHKVALLGTERAGERLALPAGAPAWALKAVAADGEGALLSLLATASLQRRAGLLLPAVENANAPSICAQEARAVAPLAACSRLRGLRSTEGPLLREWLETARARQVLAPPEALPGLLRLGARSRALRPALLPVLGERGRWLAQLNPEWAWARAEAPDEQAAFEEAAAAFAEGTGEARTAAFAMLRARDAQGALQLLEAAWPRESPSDREKWIGMLRPELSAQDEPFLESALDDRAAGVCQAAAQVLVALSGSAFVARAHERASKYLRASREQGALTIEAELPSAWRDEWARDGLKKEWPQSQPNAQAMGEKMWWLVQMISCTPPACWAAAWKAEPIEILEAAVDDEPTLRGGLELAAVRAQDKAWIKALLLVPGSAQAAGVPTNFLLSKLGLAEREEMLIATLRQGEAALVSGLLSVYNEPWGLELSQSVLDCMRALAGRAVESGQKKNARAWNVPGGHLLLRAPRFASLMHMDALACAGHGWPQDAPTFYEEARAALLESYGTRRDLRREFEM